MEKIRTFSNDQKLLLAVALCADSHFNELEALQALEKGVLTTELILRILLTFLPEGSDSASYSPLLRSLFAENPGEFSIHHESRTPIDIASVQDLSPVDANERVRQLHLLQLRSLGGVLDEAADGDLLARFLVQRSHQIDDETGNLLLVLQLVEPFVHQSENIRQWVISRVLPLLRIDYEYYLDQAAALSLQDFERLNTQAAIEILLRRASEKDNLAHIGRDLRQMVGPWMYGNSRLKRRKVDVADGWQFVNEWLLEKDFELSSQAFATWSGPQDVDFGGYEDENAEVDPQEALDLRLRYAQTAIATIYAQKNGSEETLKRARQTHKRVPELLADANLSIPPAKEDFPDLSSYNGTVTEATPESLMQGALTRSRNGLTLPSPVSYRFLTALLHSASILQGLGHVPSIRTLAEISLFATEQTQKQELRKLLQFLTHQPPGLDWPFVRAQFLWLKTWGNRTLSHPRHDQLERALFWRVDQTFLDAEFLTTLISAGQYPFAIHTYLGSTSNTALSASDCESIVESSIYAAYDNATNGNRTRGGIKRASDILKAFAPYFQHSDSFRRIEPLLAATHSLSFYHLTLEHSVPFQPVSIRVHSDPISFIGKVLDQNKTAYTKLDDLLSIGQNLVAAGLTNHSYHRPRSTSAASNLPSPITPSDPSTSTSAATHRITYLAIQSALHAQDFNTAYSYIQTRLSLSTSNTNDDTSWRAAYLAGRWRPPPPTHSPPLHAQISLLSKRMELLSLALTLTPSPEPLPEVLGTWRRCEEELGTLQMAEAEEESAWDEKAKASSFGKGGLPGEWSSEERDREGDRRESERRTRKMGNGRWEEAPVGLFEVAKGAARAMGRATDRFNTTNSPTAGEGGIDVGGGGEDLLGGEGQRIRKRDMVSGLVTGGLVKGVGWMLGAQPAARENVEHGDG